ncbi:unnamed protein product [Closterium sp. Yama58-4]|nr:unnamed protein product [Closterium sp. Yama58-4]
MVSEDSRAESADITADSSNTSTESADSTAEPEDSHKPTTEVDIGGPGWYTTSQFALERLFHVRLQQYACLTPHRAAAQLVYVPYYPGYDVKRHLSSAPNCSVTDALGRAALDAAFAAQGNGAGAAQDGNGDGGYGASTATASGSGGGGGDSAAASVASASPPLLLLLGHIAMEFFRFPYQTCPGPGSALLRDPRLVRQGNAVIVGIEAYPEGVLVTSVPYPSYFHPRTRGELDEWRSKVMGGKWDEGEWEEGEWGVEEREEGSGGEEDGEGGIGVEGEAEEVVRTLERKLGEEEDEDEEDGDGDGGSEGDQVEEIWKKLKRQVYGQEESDGVEKTGEEKLVEERNDGEEGSDMEKAEEQESVEGTEENRKVEEEEGEGDDGDDDAEEEEEATQGEKGRDRQRGDEEEDEKEGEKEEEEVEDVVRQVWEKLQREVLGDTDEGVGDTDEVLGERERHEKEIEEKEEGEEEIEEKEEGVEEIEEKEEGEEDEVEGVGEGETMRRVSEGESKVKETKGEEDEDEDEDGVKQTWLKLKREVLGDTDDAGVGEDMERKERGSEENGVEGGGKEEREEQGREEEGDDGGEEKQVGEEDGEEEGDVKEKSSAREQGGEGEVAEGSRGYKGSGQGEKMDGEGEGGEHEEGEGVEAADEGDGDEGEGAEEEGGKGDEEEGEEEKDGEEEEEENREGETSSGKKTAENAGPTLRQRGKPKKRFLGKGGGGAREGGGGSEALNSEDDRGRLRDRGARDEGAESDESGESDPTGKPGKSENLQQQKHGECPRAEEEVAAAVAPNPVYLCDYPRTVMRVHLASLFCLQPWGDSPTRRSLFDAMLAGCIPVVFSDWSVQRQFPWHLPVHEVEQIGFEVGASGEAVPVSSSRSPSNTPFYVFIPAEAILNGSANLVAILSSFPPYKVIRMRHRIMQLLPRLLYRRTREEDGTVRRVIKSDRGESKEQEKEEGLLWGTNELVNADTGKDDTFKDAVDVIIERALSHALELAWAAQVADEE